MTREAFEAALPDLVRALFEDPSLRTNPRVPLVREIEALFPVAWPVLQKIKTP